MKTLTLPLAMADNRPGDNPQLTLRCDNLRLVNGELRPVTNPNPIPFSPGTPVGRLVGVVNHHTLGRISIHKFLPNPDGSPGFSLGYALLDDPEPTVTILGPDPGDITGVTPLDADTFAILSPSGTLTLAVDEGHPQLHAPIGSFPEARFIAVDEHVDEVTVPGRRLNGTYTADSLRMNPTDTATMRYDMVCAVSALMIGSAREGRFAQGVLCRFKYFDRAGRTIFVSNPTLIAPSTGLTMADEVSAVVADDFKSYADRTMRARSFGLRILIPDNVPGLIAERVEQMSVELSLPLHPYESTSISVGEFRHRAGGKIEALFRPTSPTARLGDSVDIRQGVVAMALAAGDSAFTEVLRMRRPLQHPAAIFTVNPPVSFCRDFDEQSAALASLAKEVKQIDSLAARCRLPNRFGAAQAATSGSATLWGDLTLHRYRPTHLSAFAAETADQPWEGWMSVSFADRAETLVTLSAGSTDAPVSLLPLLCYPDPDAVRINVMVRRGEQTFRRYFPLRPTPDGSSAFFLTADGAPALLEQVTEQYTVPVDTSRSLHLPGGVIMTPSSDPATPIAASIDDVDGRVTAIAEAPRRSSSWDSSRRRLYIFSTDSVNLLTIPDIRSAPDSTTSLAASTLKFQLIDPRGVPSKRHVATTPMESAPVIAVAGGDLVAYSRASPSTLIPDVGDSQIAWDAADSELWLVNSSEGSPRCIPLCGPANYRLATLSAGYMFPTNSGLIVEDDEATLLDTSRGRSPIPPPIHYEIQLPAPLYSKTTPANSNAATGYLSVLQTNNKFLNHIINKSTSHYSRETLPRPMRLTAATLNIFGPAPIPTVTLAATYIPSPPQPIPQLTTPQSPPTLLLCSATLTPHPNPPL